MIELNNRIHVTVIELISIPGEDLTQEKTLQIVDRRTLNATCVSYRSTHWMAADTIETRRRMGNTNMSAAEMLEFTNELTIHVKCGNGVKRTQTQTWMKKGITYKKARGAWLRPDLFCPIKLLRSLQATLRPTLAAVDRARPFSRWLQNHGALLSFSCCPMLNIHLLWSSDALNIHLQWSSWWSSNMWKCISCLQIVTIYFP